MQKKHQYSRNIVRVLSTIQVLLFTWAKYIDYTQSRYNPTGNEILGAIFPEILFVVFGLLNLIAVLFYSYTIIGRKQKPDVLTTALIIFVLIIVVAYAPITNWAIQSP